jgi:phage gp37-like protein
VSPSSAFGALVAAADVERAVLAQLQLWLRDYLAEVERHHGYQVGSLPYPRSWVISSEVERMPEDQLPAVILASPGLADPPLADGAGAYTARWQLTVAFQVAARTDALRLARLYALAGRALLVQQQDLPELETQRIDWMDERYRLLDSVDDRTTCVSEVELGVEVANVTSRHQGPLEPLMPPEPGDLPPESPSWPEAVLVESRIDKVPLEEEP